MSKEYTYNIDKYTIGVDENGKDEIGLTIAIIKNGEINVLGNCYGENARCIDLLIKENEQLKRNCNIGNENLNFYRNEYKKLEHNWNKLKEIAKSQSGFKKRADLKGGLWFEVDDLLDKMQELEQGSDSNEI